MRRSIIVISTLSAWVMALVFDWIEKTTGVRVNVLLCAAIATMIFGLYKGLCTSDKCIVEEEEA